MFYRVRAKRRARLPKEPLGSIVQRFSRPQRGGLQDTQNLEYLPQDILAACSRRIPQRGMHQSYEDRITHPSLNRPTDCLLETPENNYIDI